MVCNRSALISDGSEDWWNHQIEWYLSKEDIRNIGAIKTWTAGAGALYEALAARGVAGLGALTLPSGVGAALAAVLLGYWGWIQWSNSGCGVIVNLYLLPTGATAVYIESQ